MNTPSTLVKENSFLRVEPPLAEALAWLEDSAVFSQEKTNKPWVSALRETGADIFARTGFPTPAWEGWQYLNLRPLSEQRFHYVTQDFSVRVPATVLEGAGRVVLINGRYQPQWSVLPKGVEVVSLLDAPEEAEPYLANMGDWSRHPFQALNAAYLRDGFLLKVTGDILQPIEVLYYSVGEQPTAIYPRVLYMLGKNAGLTVVERFVGAGAYFINIQADAVLEADSRMKFYRLVEESLHSVHISRLSVQQHKTSSFEGFSAFFGGYIARQKIQLDLIDRQTSGSMGGIYMLRDKQNHEFAVTADHFEPMGKSAQTFKGVVDDQARAVFQGKIHVRRSAQKTDGYQSHRALLLTPTAEASAKPELEIYADDVKCSHGAASGQLDDTALFYMRSRGIPLPEARQLLIESFLNEAVETVSYQPVKQLIQEKIALWLAARAVR